MFGYDSGVINGTQKGLEAAFDLGRLGIGINVGAILVGSAIGAFGAGRLSDAIGRRSVMMIAAVLFLFSALLAGAAGSSAVFIFAQDHRRSRRRRGERYLAGLYFRSDPGGQSADACRAYSR